MKKKLFLISPTLNSGGAESVFIIIANYLFKLNIFDLKIFILCEKGAHYTKLNSNIDVVFLNRSRSMTSIPRLIKIFVKEKPDIVFSILLQVNIIMGILKYFFKDIYFIGRENNVHSKLIKEKTLKHKIIFCSQKLFLKKLDIIVVQSEFMKNDLETIYNINPHKLIIINNPAKENIKMTRDDEPLKKDLIAIGRLNKIKNYPSMLRIFSQLDSDYTLTILGEGKLKDELIILAKNLNIIDRVYFKGYVSNTQEYIEKASILILTSYEEAFPNVVLEANSNGVFCISYNMPGGISELINKKNGKLIEYNNEKKFAKAINEVMDKGYSSELVRNEMKKFQVDKIMKQWIAVFNLEK